MSGDALTQYLSRSLAVFVFGSNDYINNYLMPSMYPSSYTYNPSDFANLLLNHYARQIVVRIYQFVPQFELVFQYCII